MSAIDRLVAAVERRHRLILFAAGLLLVLAGLSLVRLEVDMDLLAQLPSGSRTFRDWREVLEHFGAEDTVIVWIEGEPDDVAAFSSALVPRLRELPRAGSVRDRIDVGQIRDQVVRSHRWALLPEAGYRELEEMLGSEALRERVRGLRRALSLPFAAGAAAAIREDPLGVDALVARALEQGTDLRLGSSRGVFVSASGRARWLVMRPEGSAFDTAFGGRLLDAVHEVERELLEGPFAGRSISVGHTGAFVYALADRAVLERDLGLYFVVVPLAVLLVFHLGLRTLRVLPFVAAPLVIASLVTFALSLLLFGRLTMISIAFAGIFYGLGVDSSIYFYATLRKHGASGRAGLREAIAATLAEIGPANLVASSTTAASFFVIGWSDFTGVRQLGILTAIAMLLNVAGTFVLLPAMIFRAGPSALPQPARGGGALRIRGERIASALAARPGRVVVPLAAVVLVAALGATRVTLETDFQTLHPGGGEARRVEDALRREVGGGGEGGTVVVGGAGLEEALQAAERVAERLASALRDGEVESWSGVTALLPSRATMARRLERFRALPRERVAEDLRRALVEEGFDPAAFAPFFESWLGEPRELDPGLAALAPLREQHVRERGDEVLVATWFRSAAGASIGALAEGLREEGARVGSAALAAAEFRRLLERELVVFLVAALVLNFLLLLGFERRFLPAAALLLPTAAGLVGLLGVMGFAGIQIDPVNVIVFPLVLGLGVDGTVYLVAHAREGRRRGEGAGRGIGPLLLASATTIVGFGSLALAEFPALGRLGGLAGLGLSLCAGASLLLAPLLEGAKIPVAPAARDR